MRNSNVLQVSEVKSIDERLGDLPKGLSFFDPILHHEAKEAIEAGGEVYVYRSTEGHKSGFFIYDGYETTGTIFSKSSEGFDHVYSLKTSRSSFPNDEVTEHPTGERHS